MAVAGAEVVLVAAAAENGVIGREGDLPWRLPEDLRRFKQLTLGHPMVMGRKTWESIGRRPLPRRPTLVLTRDADYPLPDGVARAADIQVALELAAGLGPSPVFVAGGEGVYRAALPHADRVELTRVHAEVEGDARFPLEELAAGWRCRDRARHEADERHPHPFSFETWVRATPADHPRERHGESWHTLAREALDDEGQALLHALAAPPVDLREWVLALERWGDEVCAVAALASGRLLAERGVHGPEVPTPEAMAATELLLRHPGPTVEREARRAWTEGSGWGLEVEWSDLACEVAWRAHNVCGAEQTWERLRDALLPWLARRHAREP
ncbi:MAG: dihydrofolate reductase [Planctomycetota bacterium]